MNQWCEWYEEIGLTYFPLYGILNGSCRCRLGSNCENTGKHPRGRWKDQPNRMPTELDNVGISTDNLVVIDIDVPDTAVVDEYPETFTTTTGHGFHLWYAADERKDVKSLVGWKRKVDIRAKGGLVVAPPSRHRNGSDYRVYRGDSIVTIPNDLLYQLPERSANYHRTGVTATVELDATPELMYPYVRKLVLDVLNYGDHGRNQTLFRVACRFYEMSTKNILGDDALDAIVEAALTTGLTPDEISRTLASAKRSI